MERGERVVVEAADLDRLIEALRSRRVLLVDAGTERGAALMVQRYVHLCLEVERT